MNGAGRPGGPTRRKFVAVLAGAAGACLLPACGRSPPAAEAFAGELLGLVALPDPLTAGASYLDAHRDEHDADRLVADLFRSAGTSGRAGALEDLRERFRQDFRQGRTVTVDGWLLSRTEARLCALLSLDRRLREDLG